MGSLWSTTTRTWVSDATAVIFTARRVCIARTMLWQYVCSSVCLVTRRYSLYTGKHVLKLFSLSGSHTILIFPHQTAWRSPNRGVECNGYEKIAIFDQYLALSQKWYKIELYLQWLTNRKSYMVWSIERRHFQRPWTILAPLSMSHHYMMLNISQTVRNILDIVLMEY